MNDERLPRLLALSEAARCLVDEGSHLGKRARSELSESTGLSYEGVDYALKNCLEHWVTRSTLSGLVRSTPRVTRSHVLLSSNVFVATFRAIALALCQSARVLVRPSRRDPVMCRLLHEGSGSAFEVCEELDPGAGEHLWAYGADDTLTDLKSKLPAGLHFHGHGSKMGAALFRQPSDLGFAGLAQAVEGLARDVIAFDQRGCLSPRIVLVAGTRLFAEALCDHLVTALDKWERLVPRGKLTPDEQADALRFESTMTFVGSSVVAGRGMVFLDPRSDRIMVPPVGRYLQICCCSDPFPLLEKLGDKLSTVGFYNPQRMPGRLHEAIGERRYVALGKMQQPKFDGPVDKLAGFQAVVL